MHLLSSDSLSHLFTVETDTGCGQKELSSAVNSGVVFLQCLLHSIILSLTKADTFGTPALLLLAFASVSNCLCNDYCNRNLEMFNLLANCL